MLLPAEEMSSTNGYNLLNFQAVAHKRNKLQLPENMEDGSALAPRAGT
jgi:hypothetical protein